MHFNQIVREERIKQGYTQVDLSYRIGVSMSFLTHFELKENPDVSLYIADRLCAWLGIKHAIGATTIKNDNPTTVPFLDIVKEECEKYKNISEFSSKKDISRAMLYSWFSKKRPVSPLLSSADRVCKKLGITYVLGDGCN